MGKHFEENSLQYDLCDMTSPVKKDSSVLNPPAPGNSAATAGVKRQAPQYDPEEYLLRKRLPARLPSRSNDIYVNTKTNFKAQLARCFRCLEEATASPESSGCVYIHGLGAAAPRAINLALQLQQKSSYPLELSVNTSTVNLIGKYCQDSSY